MTLSRRDMLLTLSVAPAALAADGGTAAPPAARALKPLPFDPAKLPGLSERLLVSHHENNYGGALKNLSKVEAELARVTKDTPGFLVAGLKERELTFRNSVALHEAYFANLGGDGKASGALEKALARTFGSFARFEELFRACALALSGGSGWTVLSFHPERQELTIDWSGHHTQSLSGAAPLLVLDLYEHAYALDYGAAAARYVDAFMANVRWDDAERRYARWSAKSARE
ncbi:MAG: hypothetical protein K1X89_02125 [Myxococcaceae bacterium]|nr:hypothetical protein [Myxococcaceae bacterium]